MGKLDKDPHMTGQEIAILKDAFDSYPKDVPRNCWGYGPMTVYPTRCMNICQLSEYG